MKSLDSSHDRDIAAAAPGELDREAAEHLAPRRAAAGPRRLASSGPPAVDPAIARHSFAHAINAGIHAVQFRGGRTDLTGAQTLATAAGGVADTSAALPHLDAIQRSFGAHDVTSVRARVGGAAEAASAAIGARAYAIGSAVGFAGTPDLHLAAHEAAHVVQQRAGVQLSGGVGRAGDAYEQHADAVADLVVRGESAEALLGLHAGRGGAGGVAVQRDLLTRTPDAHQVLSQSMIPADAPRDWVPLARAIGAHPAEQPQPVAIRRLAIGDLGPAPDGRPHDTVLQDQIATIPMAGSPVPVYDTHTASIAIDPHEGAVFRGARVGALNAVVAQTERLWNQAAPLVCAAADTAHDPTLFEGEHDGFHGGAGSLDQTAMGQTVSAPGSSDTAMADLFPAGGTGASLTRGQTDGMRRASRSSAVEGASTGAYAQDSAVAEARTGIQLAQGQLVQATHALDTARHQRTAGREGRRADAARGEVTRIEGERDETASVIDEILGIAQRIGTAAVTGGASAAATATAESASGSFSQHTSIGGVIAWAAYRDELRAANERLTRATTAARGAVTAAEDSAVQTAQDGVHNALTNTIRALEAYNTARVQQRGAYDTLGAQVGAHSGLSGRDRGRTEGAIRAIPRAESVAERYASIVEICSQVPQHPSAESGEGFALGYTSAWAMTGGQSFLDCIRGLLTWQAHFTQLRDQWQQRLGSLRQTREAVRPE